jgi:hypothetical protein
LTCDSEGDWVVENFAFHATSSETALVILSELRNSFTCDLSSPKADLTFSNVKLKAAAGHCRTVPPGVAIV